MAATGNRVNPTSHPCLTCSGSASGESVGLSPTTRRNTRDYAPDAPAYTQCDRCGCEFGYSPEFDANEDGPYELPGPDLCSDCDHLVYRLESTHRELVRRAKDLSRSALVKAGDGLSVDALRAARRAESHYEAADRVKALIAGSEAA